MNYSKTVTLFAWMCCTACAEAENPDASEGPAPSDTTTVGSSTDVPTGAQPTPPTPSATDSVPSSTGASPTATQSTPPSATSTAPSVGEGGAGGAPSGGGGTAGGTGGSAGGSAVPGTTGGAGGELGTSGAGGQLGTGGAGGALGTGGAGGEPGTGGAGGAAEPGFSPCPTNGDACAVLPLGDSITEGFGSSGGGYRVELFRRAERDGKNITFVGSLRNGPDMLEGRSFPRSHQGHGGYTIDGGPGRSGISGQITNDAMANYRPHIVLLMIGTNDLNGNVDVQAAPTRLGNLMDDIIEASPDTLLVVATIIPMINGNGPKVAPYNAAIVDLVDERAARGSHVILVDNHAAFTRSASFQTEWMGDSLHPNDPGYAVLGESFYDAINAVLPNSAAAGQ